MKKVIFCLIPALLLMASCARERVPGPGQQGTDRTVQIKFTGGTTRAAVVDDAIYNLDVLVFQRASTDVAANAQYVCTRYGWSLPDGTWRTTVPITPATPANQCYDIYFAVNAHTLVQALTEGATPTIAVGMTYAAASPLLLLQAPSNSPGVNIGANGLPMWGLVQGRVIADQELNNLGTIYLLRSVGSTDVTVVQDGTFTLQQGTLCYAANQGYLAYTPANTTALPGGGFQANGPEIPTAMTSGSTADWTYNVQAADNNGVVGVFYMYENDAPINTARTSTKVVLKGVWNDPSGTGQPTYYPIALKADDGTGTMVKSQVVRNNKYVINITKVNGDGYATFDEAKAAEEVNMNYVVTVWNANMDYSATNGTQIVQLSRDKNYGLQRQAVLYRPAGSTDVIGFETNVPLTSFSMALDNGGALVNASDPTVIANSLFSVAIKTDASGNNYFEFTALQNYNAAAVGNPSTLTVTAGLVKFSITISQQDYAPTDWIDGGNTDITLQGK